VHHAVQTNTIGQQLGGSRAVFGRAKPVRRGGLRIQVEQQDASAAVGQGGGEIDGGGGFAAATLVIGDRDDAHGARGRVCHCFLSVYTT